MRVASVFGECREIWDAVDGWVYGGGLFARQGGRMSFPRYKRYKASGVEWLGEVPEHWELARFDSKTSTHRNVLTPESFSTCEVRHYSIPSVQEYGDALVEDGDDIDSNKLVVTGTQLLVSKLNPHKQTQIIATHDSQRLTLASTEFVPLIPKFCCLLFVSFVWQSDPAFQYLLSVCESATRSHQRVNPDAITKAHFAWPTVGDQEAIAGFLEEETGKIDELIVEQRRLIELLKEKRQAVISHAVTKGLNANASTREGHVDKLMRIPANWELRRLSSLSTKITNGFVGPTRDIYVEHGVRYLQSLHIKGHRIVADNAYFVSQEWSDEHSKSILKTGDVLIVQTGDIGQSAVVTDEFAGSNCHALIIVTPKHEVIKGEWLSAVTTSDFGFQTLLSIQTGALHPHLNCGDVKDIFVPVPPLAEQEEIIRWISNKRTEFDGLMQESRSVIALLQERRSALISAAVTGKIDVRNYASQSPKEAV